MSKKITQLTEKTSPAESDVVAIVDIGANETKKITRANILGVVNDLTTGGTTNPLSAEQGKELQDNKIENTGDNVTGDYTFQEGVIVGSIEGKNLFNKYLYSLLDYQVTKSFVNDDIRLTLTATGTGQACVLYIGADELLGKTLTLSGSWSASASNTGAIKLNFRDSSGGYISQIGSTLTTSGGSITATVDSAFPSGATKIAIVLQGNYNGTSVIGDTIDYTDIQIELGSTATTYYPYYGQWKTNYVNSIITSPSNITLNANNNQFTLDNNGFVNINIAFNILSTMSAGTYYDWLTIPELLRPSGNVVFKLISAGGVMGLAYYDSGTHFLKMKFFSTTASGGAYLNGSYHIGL